MNRRKVQKVMPVSATAPARQVEIHQTSSILSDPDGRWVAKRQEAINEAFRKRICPKTGQGGGSKVPPHNGPQYLYGCGGAVGKLAGESDRIGRTEWDEKTPFGKHVGFI